MLDKVIENNRVCIIGEIVSEFTFSHEVFGEGFYIANVSVNRLSDMVDVIPLMISERLIDVTKDYRGMKIEVAGQFVHAVCHIEIIGFSRDGRRIGYVGDGQFLDGTENRICAAAP